MFTYNESSQPLVQIFLFLMSSRFIQCLLDSFLFLLCRYCDPRLQQQHRCPSPDWCRREYSCYQRIQRYSSSKELLSVYCSLGVGKVYLLVILFLLAGTYIRTNDGRIFAIRSGKSRPPEGGATASRGLPVNLTVFGTLWD